MAKRLIPTDGIQLALPLTPGSETDTFAVVDPYYALGGLRTADFRNPTDVPIWDVAITYVTGERVRVGTDLFYEALRGSTGADPSTSTDDWELLVSPLSYRDTIPIRRRQLGMLVFIQPDITGAGVTGLPGANRYYRLIDNADSGDLSDSSWEELLTTDNVALSDTTNFPLDATTQQALDDLATRISTLSSGSFQGDWDPNTEPIPTPAPYEAGDFWRVSTNYIGTGILNIGGVMYDNDPSDTNPPVVINDLIYYDPDLFPPVDTNVTLDDDFFLLDASASPDISDLLHQIVTGTDTDPSGNTVRQVTSTDVRGRTDTQDIIRGDEPATANPSITISSTGVIGTSADSAKLGSDITGGAIPGSDTDTINNFLDNLNTFVGSHLAGLVPHSQFKGIWDPTTGVVPVTATYEPGDFWRVSTNLTGPLTVGGVDYDADPDSAPPLIAENDLIYFNGGDETSLANYFITGVSEFVSTSDLIHDITAITDTNDGMISSPTNLRRRQLIATDASGTPTSIIIVQEDDENNPSISIDPDGVLRTTATQIEIGDGLTTGAIHAADDIDIRTIINTLNDFVGSHLSGLTPQSQFKGAWNPNTSGRPIPFTTDYVDGDFWRVDRDLVGSVTIGGTPYDDDPDTPTLFLAENDLIFYTAGSVAGTRL